MPPMFVARQLINVLRSVVIADGDRLPFSGGEVEYPAGKGSVKSASTVTLCSSAPWEGPLVEGSRIIASALGHVKEK